MNDQIFQQLLASMRDIGERRYQTNRQDANYWRAINRADQASSASRSMTLPRLARYAQETDFRNSIQDYVPSPTGGFMPNYYMGAAGGSVRWNPAQTGGNAPGQPVDVTNRVITDALRRMPLYWQEENTQPTTQELFNSLARSNPATATAQKSGMDAGSSGVTAPPPAYVSPVSGVPLDFSDPTWSRLMGIPFTDQGFYPVFK